MFKIEYETPYNLIMTTQDIQTKIDTGLAIQDTVIRFNNIVWNSNDSSLPTKVDIDIENFAFEPNQTFEDFEEGLFTQAGEKLADLYPGNVCEDFEFEIKKKVKARVKANNTLTINS